MQLYVSGYVRVWIDTVWMIDSFLPPSLAIRRKRALRSAIGQVAHGRGTPFFGCINSKHKINAIYTITGGCLSLCSYKSNVILPILYVNLKVA
jgi:hypothetical protein